MMMATTDWVSPTDADRAVSAAIEEKNQGVDYYLIKRWPRLAYTQPCYMGSTTWTALKMDWRYVNPAHYVRIGNQHATAGMVAREYLAWKFKLPLKARGKQINDAEQYRCAPLYASVGRHGDCFYLDLKAAYWSIMNAIGWDVDYRPLKYLGLGTPVNDFPLPKHKIARNSLASVGLTGDMQIWSGFRVVSKKMGNRFKNRILNAAIMDILNSIAYDVLLTGGVKYVNTDGYIVAHHSFDDATAVLDSYGLPWSVKHSGDTEVFGIGSYRVGEHSTKMQWATGRDFVKIDGQHADFWRKRLPWALGQRRRVIG